MKIEVQYFDGCPHAAEALRLAEQVHERHPQVQIAITRVRDEEHARSIGFRGSPTILLDGEDWFGMPAPAEPHLACRFYPNGLPSFKEVEARLTEPK